MGVVYVDYCHKVFSRVYIVNCHAALCISRITVVPLIFRVNLLKLFPVADLEGGYNPPFTSNLMKN